MAAELLVLSQAESGPNQSAALKEANELLVQALSDLRYARHLNSELREKLEIANNRMEGQTLQAQKMGSEMARLRKEVGDLNVQRELQRQVVEMRAIITELLQGLRGNRQHQDPRWQKVLVSAEQA